MPKIPDPPSHNSTFIKQRRMKQEDVYIFLSPGGMFIILDREGTEITKHAELKKAEENAEKRVRQAKQIRVSVPFLAPDPENPKGPLKLHIARGRHARTDAILAWEDDGTQEGKNYTIEYWRARNVLRPDIPQQALDRQAKLQSARLQLEERMRKIDEKLSEWGLKYLFNLDVAVNTAIKEVHLERETIDHELDNLKER